MKRLLLYFFILGLSSITFASSTSDFSNVSNCFENDLDSWCCYQVQTETFTIAACSDQGCEAAMRIMVQMLSWQ